MSEVTGFPGNLPKFIDPFLLGIADSLLRFPVQEHPGLVDISACELAEVGYRPELVLDEVI
jgi:hypothetical protein